MSDPLDEMIRASRGPVTRPSDDELAERTRTRLMATARARSRRRSRWTTVLLPIAATFLATVAWAAATGRLPLPAVFSGSTDEVPPAPQPASSATSARSPFAVPTASVELTPAPSADAPTTPTEPTTLTTPDDAPSTSVAQPATPPTAPTPSASPSSSASKEDPAEALYREAHAIHFGGGSPSLAVAAWDRYIAAAPRGRFVLEAQYNRALALIRAGRRAEGLAALRGFASGTYGGYRREEAKQILDAAERVGEK
ncbi:MAG: hypothetical protein U0165_03740 [Polyangiaceae bacterium]